MQDWKKLNFCVPITESLKNENGDFLIRGVAINATTTRNRTRFEAAELQSSAPSLRNKPLLKDHNNSVDSIVGRTTQNVNFDQLGQCIVFEAFIADDAIQKKISTGLIQNVSIGAILTQSPEIIKDADGNVEAIVAKGIDFVELSLVAVPADPNAGFAKAHLSADFGIALMESFDIKIKEEATFSCQKCSESFPNKESLAKHMSSAHDESEEDETDDDGEGEEKLNSASILEAAKMAEEIKTLEALRAEREKLEMEVEALQIEKLNVVKAELSKKETIAEKSDVTISTVESSNDAAQDNYLVERNGSKISMSMNVLEMKTSPFSTEKTKRQF